MNYSPALGKGNPMTQLMPARCPSCNAEFKHVQSMLGVNRWKSGDVLLCATCGNIFIIGEHGLREASCQDLVDISINELVAIGTAQRRILQARHRRN